MEKISPPGVFNQIQHLLIHLPYEAKLVGHIQYRWMYHIERALRYLKPMIGNRARVEGCIAEAFILNEVTYFSSVYFAEEHNINALTMWYNIDEKPPVATYPFLHRGAQMLVVARATILPQKKRRLLCYTCMLA
jgi:hypothetical protein